MIKRRYIVAVNVATDHAAISPAKNIPFYYTVVGGAKRRNIKDSGFGFMDSEPMSLTWREAQVELSKARAMLDSMQTLNN